LNADKTPSTGIDRRSLAQKVADALREEILSGGYVAGDPVHQDKVAKKMHTSRVPVREALKQLESEGLVENLPYKGALVTGLTKNELGEYCEIRASLESQLLEKALPNMTKACCEEADGEILKFGQANAKDWSELNWRLHSVLYRPANRPVTVKEVAGMYRKMERYIRLHLSLSKFIRDRANDEHRELVSLCRAKNKKAVQFLHDHIIEARDELVEFLDHHD